MSNKMISRSLGIELPTVKNHVHSILAKLGIHRRTEAISLLYVRTQANEPVASVDPIFTNRRYNPIPVRVVIDVNGEVKHIHFISSFPEQAKTITDALQQWRFKPYVVNGKAVEVETGISFGTPPNKALISGRQDPQLVPARKHAPT
jgi:hypothetical protein